MRTGTERLGRSAPTLRVWDPLVRIGHWVLVASVVLAWLTRHGGGLWHEWLGYASLAVIALRVLWGFIGPRYARFADFVRPPSAMLRYARAALARREPRHLGHNPLGGWMIVALIANVVLVGTSGWLYTTDTFWGMQWVEDLHEALADTLIVLAALHVAGVTVASHRHGENLVAAMVHGRKPAPREGDVI